MTRKWLGEVSKQKYRTLSRKCQPITLYFLLHNHYNTPMRYITIQLALLAVAFPGCAGEEPNHINAIAVLDTFEDPNNYAGHRVFASRDDFIEIPNMETPYESLIFYKHQGKLYQGAIPHHPYTLFYCPAQDQVIIHSIDGILITPIAENTYRWIFHDKNMLMRCPWAINRNKTRIITTVTKLSPPSLSYALLCVDLSANTCTLHDIPASPSSVEFTDNTHALASIGDDLLAINIPDNGSPEFSLQQGLAKQRRILGAIGQTLVFYSDTYRDDMPDDEEVVTSIHLGDQTISLDKGQWVLFLGILDNHVWIITSSKKIIRIAADGSKSLIDQATNSATIHGLNTKGLWIMDRPPIVKTYNPSPATCTIEIPE